MLKELDLDESTKAKLNNFIDTRTQRELEQKAEKYQYLNGLRSGEDIVFLGDSIVEGFPVEEFFQPFDKKILNRGLSGTTTTQLLEVVEKITDGLDPIQLFLLVGTNDLAKGKSFTEISAKICKIFRVLKQKFPTAKLFFLSDLPVSEAPEFTLTVGKRKNADIRAINQSLQEYADKVLEIEFVDLYHLLSSDQGDLEKKYTTDGLHLSFDGYLRITNEIIQFLEK